VTLTILGYADRRDEIVRALGFTNDDLAAIARAGVASAFLERDEQQSLTAEIDAWLAAHPDPLQEPSR
jgi:adenosine deaminase